MRRVYLAVLSCTPSVPASAHVVGPGVGEEGFSPWSIDPVAAFLLLLLAVLYWRGSRYQAAKSLSNRNIFIRRRRYFWVGWGAMALALGSPIDGFGEMLFSVHMIQHEMLMLLAAPFMVLSRPTSAILHGSPTFLARGIGTLMNGKRMQGFNRWLISAPAAWSVHMIGLWGWHVPYLFNASLRSNTVHSLQHLSFVFIALLFWYPLVKPQQSPPAVAVLYLFTTALHASLLGALITFSPIVWYAPYLQTAPLWGFTALEDQQLGGLIMWMPAGIAFIFAGLVMTSHLLKEKGT